MHKTLIFTILILIIYVPFAFLDYNHFPYSDGAEHGAAVRELAKNMANPEDPMLANHSGNSPRFVPSIFVMALFMKLLDMDVLVVLKIFLILYFILFLVAVSLFSKEYFDDPGQAPWSITALLFLWGSGWMGANAYMFSALLYTAYFPSVVSFSVALLALYFQLGFLRHHKKGFLIAEIFLGAIAFVNHPLTGIFFFICSGLLYLEKKGLNKKTLALYALSAGVALLFITLWPYYSFFANLLKLLTGEMGQATDYQITQHYLHSKFLVRSGPALAGIPCIILFLKRKSYLMLVGSFFIFCLIYLTGYVFRINLTERFVFFMMFSLQLSVSRTCREWLFPLRQQQGNRKITAFLLAFLLLLGMITQAVFIGKNFITPTFSFKPGTAFPIYANPNTMQLELKNYLKERDVVLSDIYSSWSIPVYTGAKIIALFHTPPHVNDNLERIKAVKTFYATETSDQTRKAILAQYKITHVFLNFKTAGRELEAVLRKMGFPVVASGTDFRLFTTFSPQGDESIL